MVASDQADLWQLFARLDPASPYIDRPRTIDMFNQLTGELLACAAEPTACKAISWPQSLPRLHRWSYNGAGQLLMRIVWSYAVELVKIIEALPDDRRGLEQQIAEIRRLMEDS